MWLEKIALFCIFIMALFGALFIGIILHEYSHYNDFKDLNVTDNEICGLVLPVKWTNMSDFTHSAIGYYSFRINESDPIIYAKYKANEKNTEQKAYLISALVAAFFVFCYWIISFARMRDKINLLDKDFEGVEKDFYIHQLESYILKHHNLDNQTSSDDYNNP